MSSLRVFICVFPLILAAYAACSAPDGAGASGALTGEPTTKKGSEDTSNPLSQIDIDVGGVLDVDLTIVEREFWVPRAFTGDGCAGEKGMWGETVQRALWFLNVNRSGPDITRRFIQWRGDSHMEDAHIKLIANDPRGVNMSEEHIEEWRHVLDPDGDGELDMAGGFYDAGDFLKIGITSNYMAHTLAWTMWTFPEAFAQTGMRPEALSILRWYADFVMKNTYVENPGEVDPWKWNVVAYGHGVGGPEDHDCGWMPPELRRSSTCPRRAFFATHEAPAADVTAGAAAALALIGWHLRGEDPEYATKALNHAIALYEFAKLHHGTTWDTGGLYQSEDAYDDLAWAAVWLHEVLPVSGQPGARELTDLYASHKESYLLDIVGDAEEIGHEPWPNRFRNGGGFNLQTCKENSAENGCWTESWTHIWNSLRSGVFVKVAEILQRYGGKYAAYRTAFRNIARADSLAWVTGPHSEGGFAKKVDVSWGSGRYNSAGQLIALTFARTFPDDVIPESYAEKEFKGQPLTGRKTAEVLASWAKDQSEYLLGDNPLGQSYMMGYTGDFAEAAHHAATHASIYGLCDVPLESKHIAHGALVSGPNSGDDHSDDRCDYGANEITIDYNAAFIGALAGNYAFFGQGQCPDPLFPPIEEPFDEFYTKARINASHDCNTQVEITFVNETAHPPRFDPTVTYRYYVDLSELQERGIDPASFTANVIHNNYNEEPVIVSELKPCSLNTSTFYFEFAYPYEFWGEQVWLKGPRVALVEFGFGYTNSCIYDTSNDWSLAPLTAETEKSPTIPAYSEGALVWGAEPECHEPPRVVISPPVIR